LRILDHEIADGTTRSNAPRHDRFERNRNEDQGELSLLTFGELWTIIECEYRRAMNLANPFDSRTQDRMRSHRCRGAGEIFPALSTLADVAKWSRGLEMKKVRGTCSPRGKEKARIIRADDLLNLSAARSIDLGRRGWRRFVSTQLRPRENRQSGRDRKYNGAVICNREGGRGRDISASEGYLRRDDAKRKGGRYKRNDRFARSRLIPPALPLAPPLSRSTPWTTL